MKRLFLFLLIMAIVLASRVMYAAERGPLEDLNVALKLDYINFTEGKLKNSDVDTGLYVGLEGYAETKITPNLYVGMEVGYANPDGSVDINGTHVDTEVTFFPIEINLKYAIKIKTIPNFVIDFGAGGSYIYVKEKATVSELGIFHTIRTDDWLLGGQFFADLTYKVDNYFIGINAKYQLTENLKDRGYNYNNWRIGGQIGMMF